MSQPILLFDFDGTIADTADVALRIYNTIAQERGFRMITPDILDHVRGLSARDVVAFLGVPLYQIPFIARRARAMFSQEIPHLQPVAGIIDALATLHDQGCHIAIVSSNSEQNIRSFLDRHAITVCRDIYSVSNIFGKDRALRKLVRSQKWDLSSVWYIGDEARDVEAARAAGVHSVAVCWGGFNTRAVLEKSQPDALCVEVSELKLTKFK